MKSSNNSSLQKFVSFLLIAVLLVFVVGFAANGWQEDFGKPDNGEDGDKTDNTDENTDGTNNNQNQDNSVNNNNNNTGNNGNTGSDDTNNTNNNNNSNGNNSSDNNNNQGNGSNNDTNDNTGNTGNNGNTDNYASNGNNTSTDNNGNNTNTGDTNIDNKPSVDNGTGNGTDNSAGNSTNGNINNSTGNGANGNTDNSTNNGTNNNTGNTPPPQDDTTDEGTQAPPQPDLPKPPIYISNITGLEISESQKTTVPYGFVVNPSAPLYGISSSELAIEFPIEDGTTRMLSYTTDDSMLWKIGSLVETRAFISGMAKLFGGIVVSYGNDDMISYSIWDLSKYELDLSHYSRSFYIENSRYVYTSMEKLELARDMASAVKGELYKKAPFDFTDEAPIFGVSEANSVIIPFSEKSETELYYSPKTDRYLLYKSGNRKVDMLSGQNIAYENVFILFANATTYEKANGTELVMDITSGGKGYYVTKGTYSEITWALNENGELNFYTLDGERLVANAGNSYISYYKASCSSAVKIN